jgi:hypothetical protein
MSELRLKVRMVCVKSLQTQFYMLHRLVLQGQPTQQIGTSAQTNAILSTQHTAIHQ